MTAGHASRCAGARLGRYLWPQADRWIRGPSAASVRTHRCAPARGLQPATSRLLGVACCCARGVWALCTPRSLWFLSVAAAAEAEQPQRAQRTQRPDTENPAASSTRETRCSGLQSASRRASRDADCRVCRLRTVGRACGQGMSLPPSTTAARASVRAHAGSRRWHRRARARHGRRRTLADAPAWPAPKPPSTPALAARRSLPTSRTSWRCRRRRSRR